MQGFKDIDYDAARIRSQNKEGWKMIALSASWIMPVIVEYAKAKNPTGTIPFKISKEGGRLLPDRLNELFKDRLARYDNYKMLSRQGKEGNPDDQTWLIFAVARIKDILSINTYEEAEQLEKENGS